MFGKFKHLCFLQTGLFFKLQYVRAINIPKTPPNTFRFDYNLKQNHAWFAVVSVPVVLFLLGLRELIDIIGFVGAVFGGVLGILIALTYWSLKKSPVCKKHKCLNFPNILTWLLIMLFTGGIILEITSTLIK